ncbi:MAG: diacylglycerol kinase family lipid kinase [Actinomycetota bacterium]|nr:diacylglycerol kinase family lipid kinase [Actinomycetota bacterium]
MRVICNPASGGGAYEPASLRAVLGGLEPDWVVTKARGDAREAAREWRGGLLVVAGGDGTMNEAVNGLGMVGFPGDVTLALLPTGTGNDLAATLKVPTDPKRAAEAIWAGQTRTLDAARIRSGGVGELFFANVAVGGAGTRVSKAADDEMFKGRWGKLSYLRASLEVARSLETYEVRLTVDGTQHMVRAANLVVGNCRYAGGGWPAAPQANPEDGLLDLVVIEDTGLSDMLALTPRALARTDYQESEGTFSPAVRTLR